jgi:hypothetical protein
MLENGSWHDGQALCFLKQSAQTKEKQQSSSKKDKDELIGAPAV